MHWREALDLAVARTGHERYRALCDDAHPDHEAWRLTVLALAGEPVPAGFPPAAAMATNLARSLWDWATSGFAMASGPEADRRRTICRACDRFQADSGRCLACGCSTAAKTVIRVEHCPIGKW